jgi:7-cyano-7-deazaguanine synthase in queuosine biosynthesis
MKVVSHMSGGFDSAASTIMVAEAGHEFQTLMIDLGQPYAEQERAAVVELEFFLRGRYPSTYYGHSTLRVDMALTQVGQVVAYIPVRNLVIGLR